MCSYCTLCVLWSQLCWLETAIIISNISNTSNTFQMFAITSSLYTYSSLYLVFFWLYFTYNCDPSCMQQEQTDFPKSYFGQYPRKPRQFDCTGFLPIFGSSGKEEERSLQCIIEQFVKYCKGIGTIETICTLN